VPDPSSFYVAPSTFSGKEGPWYRYPEGGSAIQVKEPRLRITIYDETAGFDATGKWIPRGDVVSFKIESNLYEAGRRGDGAGGPVDIIIKNPGGAEYSSVQGPSGSFSLEGVRTVSSLYSTGPVWSTGDEEAGTYRIHAKGALNRLGDNNPVVGAGVSEEISVLIQGSNPLIKSGKDTAITAGEAESLFAAGSEELSSVTPVRTIPVIERTSPVTPMPTTSSPAATTVVETPAVRETGTPATPVTTAPISPVTPVQTRETPLYAFIPIAALVVLLGIRRG
jgi:hypothetical protein